MGGSPYDKNDCQFVRPTGMHCLRNEDALSLRVPAITLSKSLFTKEILKYPIPPSVSREIFARWKPRAKSLYLILFSDSMRKDIADIEL